MILSPLTQINPSFRAERPDFFFRAVLWRIASRSRGIPLPSSSVLAVSSGVNFLVFSSSALPLRTLRLCVIFFLFFLSTFNFQLSTLSPVAAAFRGARLFASPSLVAPMIIQRPTSAGGAQEVSPARKGWVPVSTIFPSAVGAAPSSFAQSLSSRPKGRAVCGPQRLLCAPCGSPGWRDRGTSTSTRPDTSFRAKRGIPLLFSFVLSVFFVMSFLVFSSSVLPLRTLRLCVICSFLFLSTLNFELSTPEPHLP